MPRLPRSSGSRRLTVITSAIAGVIGALGVVGVSVAASIVTLDGPAQVGTGAVRFAPPPPEPASTPTAGDPALRATLVAINEIRATAGLSSFAWNDVVAKAAQAHSDDMAEHRKMTHTGSDGSSAGDRLTRAGFVWSAWAENIAAGQTDPVALVGAWMASSGHRRHLLGDFRYAGVGVATSADGTRYWTLDLAS